MHLVPSKGLAVFVEEKRDLSLLVLQARVDSDGVVVHLLLQHNQLFLSEHLVGYVVRKRFNQIGMLQVYWRSVVSCVEHVLRMDHNHLGHLLLLHLLEVVWLLHIHTNALRKVILVLQRGWSMKGLHVFLFFLRSNVLQKLFDLHLNCGSLIWS